jgi:hypothetical protein
MNELFRLFCCVAWICFLWGFLGILSVQIMWYKYSKLYETRPIVDACFLFSIVYLIFYYTH